MTRASLGAWLVFTLVTSGCGSTEPDQPTTWGSEQANLSIDGNVATVKILASGGCYGSYGEIPHAIPAGTFTLPGTYTQLIGAFPGSIQYAAEYSGSIVADTMTLTISVPALQQTIGPFHLIAGVTASWSPCLYP